MVPVTSRKCVSCRPILRLLCSPALVSAKDTGATYITFQVAGSQLHLPVAVNNSHSVLHIYLGCENRFPLFFCGEAALVGKYFKSGKGTVTLSGGTAKLDNYCPRGSYTL
jgi:hypothetical protein